MRGDHHGGPDVPVDGKVRAEELAVRLGRSGKRVARCLEYGHYHSWSVNGDGWRILNEVPQPVDEELPCFRSRCSQASSHAGAHDTKRDVEGFRIEAETAATMSAEPDDERVDELLTRRANDRKNRDALKFGKWQWRGGTAEEHYEEEG